MGHIISTAKTFASVPGLKIWMDGRYGKETSLYLGNPVVNRWRSLGPLDITFNQLTQVKAPKDISPFVNHLNSVDPGVTQGLIRNSDPSLFNFLHSNNFGVFGINRYNYTSGTSSPFFANGLAGTANHGFLIRHNGALETIQCRLVNGSGVVASQLSSPAVFPQNTINSWGLVRRSINSANNIRWFKDQAQISQTSITTVAAGDCIGSMHVGLVDNNTVGELDQGLLLVYDWTGYTEAQIDAFVTTVNTLITLVRPNFV